MTMGVVMVRMVPFGEKGRPCGDITTQGGGAAMGAGASRGEKGRLCGECHGRARWTDEQVERMRDMHDGGMRFVEIRAIYNVPKSTLSEILNYRSRAILWEV